MRGINSKNEKNRLKKQVFAAVTGKMGLKSEDSQKAHIEPQLKFNFLAQFGGEKGEEQTKLLL